MGFYLNKQCLCFCELKMDSFEYDMNRSFLSSDGESNDEQIKNVMVHNLEDCENLLDEDFEQSVIHHDDNGGDGGGDVSMGEKPLEDYYTKVLFQQQQSPTPSTNFERKY